MKKEQETDAGKRAKKEKSIAMPEWVECTWRRMPCGKASCKICGGSLGDRRKQVLGGRDPDSAVSILEDTASSFREAIAMLKKEAKRAGIDITNLDDIKQPPPPRRFPLYKRVNSWQRAVYELAEEAYEDGELWTQSEAAADLLWYKNTLAAKVYRQLCNRWHLEQGDGYGEFDHEYTRRVLRECLVILRRSLRSLSFLRTDDKGELILAFSRLRTLERDILEI